MVLLGRTMLWIVTRWFALEHEREREKRISAGSSRFEEHNILLPMMALYVKSGTCGVYRAVRC
jgi:glycine betaine/choline ABC-type transport system substrate-binding protein